MPIRPNRDYWHKINELWDEQENVAKNPQKMTACKGTRFLYHNNQLVAEIPLHSDGNTALAEDWEEAVYWFYQNDDFTPTARLHKGELHYTISDQIGTITELMSEKGYIHYRQKLNLWGEAKTETLHYDRASNDEIICNHRFVGQYYDEESGLHYNRFRYYSPETAQYLQSDPIGLLGGFNPYGYVFNPTGWVDPLGLQSCSNLQKEIKDLQSGKDVTVNSFKKADQVLYGAFPKTRKVRGAGIKSPIKTSSQKKQFKLQPYEKGNTAIYHKDYKFNQDRTTLIGHEGLPNGHPHKTIPHINVLTPTGKKATIYIKGD